MDWLHNAHAKSAEKGAGKKKKRGSKFDVSFMTVQARCIPSKALMNSVLLLSATNSE